jgi:hypothetical protein
MAGPEDERGFTPSEPRGRATSDLIGLWVTLGLAVGFLAMLGAFFFVGAVAGVIVLLALVVVGIAIAVAAVRRADQS